MVLYKINGSYLKQLIDMSGKNSPAKIPRRKNLPGKNPPGKLSPRKKSPGTKSPHR